MEDKLCGQQARTCGDRLAGRTGMDALANLAELAHDFRAARTVDGTIDTSAAYESRVGGVDNGVNADLRDVSFDELQFAGAGFNEEHF